MPTPQGSGARTLSRDFKHVRRHTPVAAGQTFSGWMGLGVGLSVGLAVALGVHLYDRSQFAAAQQPVPAATQPPASSTAGDDAAVAPEAASPDTPDDLNFYDMLPRQEVEVPDKPAGPRAAATTRTPLPTGGAVMQVGSFKQMAEAERMQARLAVAGVNSKIQRTSVDDETYYRVRIGPIATVEELQVTENRLREAEITPTYVTPSDEGVMP